METTSAHDPRITPAVAVDRAYSDFEIQMNPGEATLFARESIATGRTTDMGLSNLLLVLDRAIPAAEGQPETGRAKYRYRIGRRTGRRTLSVLIRSTDYQGKLDVSTLFESFIAFASSVDAILEIDNLDHVSIARFVFQA